MKILAVVGALAALPVLGAAYQLSAQRRDRRRLAPAGQLVPLGNGRRLHAHCSGTGSPTVILESGIAASSLSWTVVHARVAAFATVCSYDRVGLGWSDDQPTRLTASGHAEMLHTLLGVLRVAPPYVLVGHSYGSFVVRAYARRYPRDVAGLVLVDPIYATEWAEPSPELQRRLRGGIALSHLGRALAAVGFVRLALKLLTGGAPGAARRIAGAFGSEAAGLLRRLVGEVQKLPADTWPAVQALWSQPKCFAAMARHLAMLPASARELADQTDLGDMPLVVLTGGRQSAACQAEQRRLAALSSRGRQVVVPESGHWVQLDNADLVIHAIHDVIAASSTVRSTDRGDE
jgi:pimeloyl-ACP methyl ester carboxylesterase